MSLWRYFIAWTRGQTALSVPIPGPSQQTHLSPEELDPTIRRVSVRISKKLENRKRPWISKSNLSWKSCHHFQTLIGYVSHRVKPSKKGAGTYNSWPYIDCWSRNQCTVMSVTFRVYRPFLFDGSVHVTSNETFYDTSRNTNVSLNLYRTGDN
jgi:hypothetical protein